MNTFILVASGFLILSVVAFLKRPKKKKFKFDIIFTSEGCTIYKPRAKLTTQTKSV